MSPQCAGAVWSAACQTNVADTRKRPRIVCPPGTRIFSLQALSNQPLKRPRDGQRGAYSYAEIHGMDIAYLSEISLMLRHLLRFGIRQKVVLILLATLVVGLTASTWLAFALANRRHPQRNHAPWQRSQPLRRAHAGLQRHRLRLPHHRAAVARTRVARRCRLRPRHQPQGQCDERGGRRQRRASGRHAIPPGYPAQQRKPSVSYISVSVPTASPPRSKKQKQDSILRQLLVIFGVLAVELAALSYIIVRPLNIMSRAMRARRRWARAPRPTFRSRPRTNWRDRHAIQRIARAPERGA